MEVIETLENRKQRRTGEMRLAVDQVVDDLKIYAREHKGKFILFGSAAAGQLRFDSDVDIIVDFHADKESDAWRFVEEVCWKRKLTPDVRPLRYICQDG